MFFDFHTGESLKTNYITIEIVVIVVTYLFQNLLIGASSIISLKELVDGIELLFLKKEIANKHYVKVFIFFLNSCISLICTLLINKLLFKIYGNEVTSKMFLIIIVIIMFCSCLISYLFYCLFTSSFNNDKEKLNNTIPKIEYQEKKILQEININNYNRDIMLFSSRNKQLKYKKIEPFLNLRQYDIIGNERNSLNYVKTCT